MFRPEILGDVLLWDSKLPQVLPTLGPNVELALVVSATKAFFRRAGKVRKTTSDFNKFGAPKPANKVHQQ